MKTDATKHPRVGEDEADAFQIEHEMSVFGRGLIEGSGGEFAGHTQMHAEPSAMVEAEDHLFGGGGGVDELRTNKVSSN